MSKTVAQWRNILKLSYGKNGITIKGIKTSETHLEIPEMIGNQSVVAIDAYAFHLCKTLEGITLPSTVKEIGCSAFRGCTNLSSLISQNEKANIAFDAFANCPKLADSQGFVIISHILFGYFGSSSQVHIPETVREISHLSCCGNGQYTQIKRIVIPNGVSTITDFTFSRYTELEYIYIPESTNRIDANAFRGCQKLSIETPAGSIAEQFALKNNIPLIRNTNNECKGNTCPAGKARQGRETAEEEI